MAMAITTHFRKRTIRLGFDTRLLNTDGLYELTLHIGTQLGLEFAIKPIVFRVVYIKANDFINWLDLV